MTSRVELLMARRSLGAFIQADEVEIVFKRTVKTQTTTGSWIEGDAPLALDPQKFRVVPFKRRLSHLEADTQDGNIPITAYVLVGRVGCDVQRDDEFELNGRPCKVVGVETTTNTGDTDRVVVEFEAR